MTADTDEIREVGSAVKNTLLSQLATARKAMGLTQEDVAARAGVSRLTISRAEAEDADTSLSTFALLAVALNLTPRLVPDDGEGDAEQFSPGAKNIVHRGHAHNRINHDRQWRDRQRERALAMRWEAANQESQGLAPLLQSLVPNHTQEQASAAATVIQWLGSDIGFDFLTTALAEAGYSVVDRGDSNPTAPAVRRKRS